MSYIISRMATDPVAHRVRALDVARGLVMVLMAIDHVRVYSGVPAGGPAPAVFFTRGVTHFCAPGFVFFAGSSAFLRRSTLRGTAELSRYLLTRGLLIVLLELTVMRFFWTFNFDYEHYMLAGVIWMLGWCMILMAGLVRLPLVFNTVAGIAIVALHNVTSLFGPAIQQHYANSDPNWFLKFLYFGSAVRLGESGPPIVILYVIVPWIGLMMAGYGFGKIVMLPPDQRRRVCLRLGAALTLAFILLRGIDVYGDPRPWQIKPPAQTANAQAKAAPARPNAGPPRSAPPAVLRFLNTTKYPASLSFLLMTIGPMIFMIGLAEGLRGRIADMVTLFGRVPMFYYLLHIPLIHAAACVVSLIREGHVDPWLFTNHPMANPAPPPNYQWSLGLLYLVYLICLVILYFPCKWYAGVRARRKSGLLSYI